jgi:hypothetical protein
VTSKKMVTSKKRVTGKKKGDKKEVILSDSEGSPAILRQI